MKTQRDIDNPKRIVPASELVTNKQRDFSKDFYIRERRNREPFFVMTPELESALLTTALTVALSVLFAALILDDREIMAFLWGK